MVGVVHAHLLLEGSSRDTCEVGVVETVVCARCRIGAVGRDEHDGHERDRRVGPRLPPPASDGGARNRRWSVCAGHPCLQYLILDIATLRFPFAEFVRQAAFMASASALPTMFVAIPIGVTLSIQFGLLAGQVGATSLAGAASGLAVIKQGAPMVAALLMASAAGSAVCADLAPARSATRSTPWR